MKAISRRSSLIDIRNSEVINQDEEYIEQEESDEWDPAIGMRDEDRKNKQNNNDLLILLSLILLCIIGIPSGLFFITRNRYKGDKDPKTIALENTIKNLGTKIKDRNDCEPGVLGYYRFEKYKVDEVGICRNNLGEFGPNADERYWKVLAHEATHIMQACLGTTIYGPIQQRDMSYVLLVESQSLIVINLLCHAHHLNKVESLFLVVDYFRSHQLKLQLH